MNCTNCGKEITGSICSSCGTDHTDLFYKMVEDAQVRRDYPEALSYMIMIRKSCAEKAEVEEIDRKIAKLQFSMTDLTGNSLHGSKNHSKKLNIAVRAALGILVVLAVFMSGVKLFSIMTNSAALRNKNLPVALNLVLKEKDLSNEINIEKIEYIINLLQSRDDLKLNMVLNGLLLEKIKLKNPSIIVKMKSLLENGKLELLGTTYSEAVLAANDPDSNRWQIEEYMKLLKRELNYIPAGFWNEGGVWTEKVGKLIADYGFEYVIIEDRVIKNSNSKASEYIARSTENGKLVVINNDKDFIFKVERFLLERDNEILSEIEDYIATIQNENENGDYILNYSSNIYLEDIDLLSVEELIEKITSLKTVKIINYPMILNEVDLVREDITPIKAGASVFADMEVDLVLQDEYNSWLDFNSNSKLLNEFRNFFRYHEQMINSLDKNYIRLKELYKKLYLLGQYKFGKPYKKSIENSDELNILGKIAEYLAIPADEFEELERRNHYVKNGDIVYLEKNDNVLFLYNAENDEYFENLNGDRKITIKELIRNMDITLYTND